MKLVYTATQKPVRIDDVVELRDGPARVSFFRRPNSPASSGKVSCTYTSGDLAGHEREFYVGVIGAEWIEREDREPTPELDALIAARDARNASPIRTWVCIEHLIDEPSEIFEVYGPFATRDEAIAAARTSASCYEDVTFDERRDDNGNMTELLMNDGSGEEHVRWSFRSLISG